MRYLFVLVLFIPVITIAQLTFEFRWGNERILPNTQYHYAVNNSISFEELKLYISDIYLVTDAKREKIADVCFVDFEDSISGILNQKYIPMNNGKLIFTLGLDSIYHVNMDYEGDLDPVLGMYWAWNTGYIHVKIVAKCSESIEKNGLLDYHLGGYLKPNATMHQIELDNVSSTIYIDLLPLFEKEIIKPSVISRVVLPGKEANRIMKSLSTAIRHD